MNVAGLKKFCAGLRGSTERLYEAPYNILVFQVGGKTFAYFKTSAPEKWRFSVRVTPDRFLELTDRPGIKPARYRGRYHWVTIVKVQSVPEDYLAELVRASYRRALDSLSRKSQLTIGRTMDKTLGKL
jgi:predicted DNA-binding protein (MmcQ/YjbR family)